MSLPPVSGEERKKCKGYIVSREIYRHHRRLPGSKLPPRPEFWNSRIDNHIYNSITWVNKPENPLDLRSTAPAMRYKPLYKRNVELNVIFSRL